MTNTRNNILLLAVAIIINCCTIPSVYAVSPRIVGGETAGVGDYPWYSMVFGRFRVTNQFSFFCGGSLIHPDIVLSAAHCFTDGTNFYENDLKVVIGAYKKPYLTDNGDNGGQYFETRSVDKIIVHPHFDDYLLNFDFALLRLSEKSSITPIQIDKDGLSETYLSKEKELWIAGHGDTYYDAYEAPVDELKHVAVQYISNRDCKRRPYLHPKNEIRNNMLCAAGLNKDSCSGDSGGPLVDRESNKLVGVTSWGFDCGHPQYPGVYGRISRAQKWIGQKICGNSRFTSKHQCKICTPGSTTGKTHYVPSDMGCWTIELFSGGVLALDETDPYCMNSKLSENKTVISKYMKYTPGKGKYVFQGSGSDDEGYYGRIKIRENQNLPGYRLKILEWKEVEKEFMFVLRLPDCEFGSCRKDEKPFHLKLTADYYPDETRWDLVNLCSNEIVGSGRTRLVGVTEVFDICLEKSASYEFQIRDKFGDGNCCSVGEGGYSITYDGLPLAEGGNFGYNEKVSFGENCTST